MKNKKFIIPAVFLGGILVTVVFLSHFGMLNDLVTNQDYKKQIPSNKEEKHSEHEKQSKTEEHDEHGSNEEKEIVRLSDEEMKEFGIEIGVAGAGKLHTYVSLPGEVTVNPDRLTHIVPRVSGVVRKVRKTIGDIVRTGEIMAVLESAEFGKAKIKYLTLKRELELVRMDLERLQTIHDNTGKMLSMLKKSPKPEILREKTKGLDMGENRSLLISAYTTLILTRETYKREKRLYEKKISSRADFLKAEKDYKSAQAHYTADCDKISFFIRRNLLDKSRSFSVAESALHVAERWLHVLGMSEKELNKLRGLKKHDAQLTHVNIRSPFKGTVVEKHITLGEVVDSDSKIFAVADLSTVWVNLSVYQKDLPFVRKGQSVIITAGKAIPEVKGEISWVRQIVGEATRTSPARIVLSNPDGIWRPGLFVTGKIAINEVDIPLMVPKTAVQIIDDKNVVFIVTKNGCEPQPVKVGRSDEKNSEILSGLNAGQWYVTKGGFTLKSNLSKKKFGGGHGGH